MDLNLKVLLHLNNFIIKNSSYFDSDESIKREDPVIVQLSNEVFGIIFEKDISDIKFNLKNHYRHIDKKSWSEIKEFSDSDPSLMFTKRNLEENINTMVYLCLLDLLSVNGKGLTDEELDKFEKNERSYVLNFLLKKNRLARLFSEQRCGSCETTLRFEFDYIKKEFTLDESIKDCPCTEHKMKFSLEVPTKELVFVNDIRHAFRVERENQYKHSVNSVYGKILECEEYLKYNIAYISLRSGSVEILHSEKEKLVVIDPYQEEYYKPIEKNETYWDDEDDDDEDEDDWDEEPRPIDGFKKEGQVDLELWGVFMMDKKTYEKIYQKAGFSLNFSDAVRVKIKGTKVDVDYDLDECLIEAKYN